MRVILGPMPCQHCGRSVYYGRDGAGVAAIRETDGDGRWVGHYCAIEPYTDRRGFVRATIDRFIAAIKGGDS